MIARTICNLLDESQKTLPGGKERFYGTQGSGGYMRALDR